MSVTLYFPKGFRWGIWCTPEAAQDEDWPTWKRMGLVVVALRIPWTPPEHAAAALPTSVAEAILEAELELWVCLEPSAAWQEGGGWDAPEAPTRWNVAAEALAEVWGARVHRWVAPALPWDVAKPLWTEGRLPEAFLGAALQVVRVLRGRYPKVLPNALLAWPHRWEGRRRRFLGRLAQRWMQEARKRFVRTLFAHAEAALHALGIDPLPGLDAAGRPLPAEGRWLVRLFKSLENVLPRAWVMESPLSAQANTAEALAMELWNLWHAQNLSTIALEAFFLRTGAGRKDAVRDLYRAVLAEGGLTPEALSRYAPGALTLLREGFPPTVHTP